MQVVIFNRDVSALESDLEAWMSRVPGLKIRHVSQSESLVDDIPFVTLTVFYDCDSTGDMEVIVSAKDAKDGSPGVIVTRKG